MGAKNILWVFRSYLIKQVMFSLTIY